MYIWQSEHHVYTCLFQLPGGIEILNQYPGSKYI